MIPEKLVLKGIYSYKNETVIDFSTLCRADLFGIFGNVGSGKSAVLEAITYVLYGRIERLSTKVYYNMMNLMSDRMYIDFIFNHAGQRYRFTFETKRNRKVFDKIETPERSGYIEKDGEWVPLFDKDFSVSADGIIGLSYDNFRRTVIVPQGRFQEFLHLEKSRRTEMLMELFQLDRFDLYSKAASLAGRNAERTAAVEGELSGLADVDAEGLEAAQAELSRLEAEMSLLGDEVKISDRKLVECEELLKLFTTYSEVKKELELKLGRTDEIERRKEALARFERCRELFRLDVSSLSALKQELDQAESSLSQVASNLGKDRKAAAEAEQAFAEIQAEHSRLEEYRQRAGWYSLLTELRNEENKARELRSRLSDEQDQLVSLVGALSGCTEALKQNQAELSGLDSGPLTADLMRQLSASFAALGENSNNIQNETVRLDAVRTELSKFGGKISTLRGVSELSAHGFFKRPPESLSAAAGAVAALDAELAAAERDIRRRVFEAGVASEIRAIAESLEDGKPCPVCGATSHPSPSVSASGIDDELRTEEEEHERLKHSASVFKEGLLRLQNEESALRGQLESIEERIESGKAVRERLIEDFPSDLFCPDKPAEFRAAWDDFIKADEKRQHLQQMSSTLSREAENYGKHRGEMESAINSLKISLASTEASIAGRRERIEEAFIEANEGKSSGQLADELKRLGHDIERINADYERLNLLRKNTGISYEKRLTEHNLIENRRNELRGRQEDAENKLRMKIDESEFTDLDEISALLAQRIDPGKEREEIELTVRAIDRLTAESERLERELGGRRYDEAGHAKILSENEELKQKMNTASSSSGRIRNVIADLERRLLRKSELEQTLDLLRLRGENINTLRNLFKGKKFIDYVSTVYLKDLCEAANSRFRKLTKESLRLELDEMNNFIVRDYLNEGKIRSIKTLSGGQTFQAAFSLSLALADSIGRERSGFFFLDEGFGSLDRESLALVFESLKSLKKEERTVGIISHVEELKQEIDTYITVKKETDEGSLVANSWEQQ